MDQRDLDKQPRDEQDPSVDDEGDKADKAQKPETKRWEWRGWKLLRVAAYAAFVCLLFAFIAVGSSYGDVKQSALDVGEELGKLGDIGHKTPILLNDQRIFVASSVLELSVEETLDRAEAVCDRGAPLPWSEEARDPSLAPELLLDNPTPELEADVPTSDFTIREERDGTGVVLCFARPDARPGDGDAAKRFGRVMSFLRTGNLEHLGGLRYLYARPTSSGRTQLIGVWTDGPFDFYAMAAGPDGDAPGSDPEDVPRPPDSVRLLSATVEVAPYAVRVYETPRRPAEVAAAYDRQMPERGWELVVPDGDTRVYQKEDITVFVTPTLHDGRVLVSMLHMGSE